MINDFRFIKTIIWLNIWISYKKLINNIFYNVKAKIKNIIINTNVKLIYDIINTRALFQNGANNDLDINQVCNIKGITAEYFIHKSKSCPKAKYIAIPKVVVIKELCA